MQQADALAAKQGWKSSSIQSRHFALTVYYPVEMKPASELTIYMEGDGLAWISTAMPSTDPTPANPVALKMALAHPNGNAVYLARPCQYRMQLQDEGCNTAYWTDKRFAPEAVLAMNDAVTQLKAHAGAKSLRLVGYSGGAAMAVMVAAARDDAIQLITVAGNLDTAAWTRHHRLTPLKGSLNPADSATATHAVPQLHLVGADDRIVPPLLAQAYADRFPSVMRPPVRVVEGYTHQCCWAENWSELWLSFDESIGSP